LEKKAGSAVRIASYEGLHALIVPSEMSDRLKDYWRFSGEIISSRLAQDVTTGNYMEGHVTGERLRASLARSFGVYKEDVFLYESGMAAIFTVHRLLTALRPGKKTLQVDFPYTDAMKVQEHFGSGVVMLSESSGESFGEALQRIRAGEFAAVFCETPSNPMMRSVDLSSLSQACRDSGIPLIVDDTIATHHNVDVLPYADLVSTSLTKWISGVGDVVAGSLRVNHKSPLADLLLSELSQDSPHHSRLYERDAEVLLENMKGFRRRIRQSNESALKLAEYLEAHTLIDQVWYPKFVSSDNYERVMCKGGGYGGVISFVLKNQKKTKAFYDQLRWNKGPSLGTEFSLASPYTMLAHYHELEWAEGCGVPANLIRLSVGNEPVDKLRESLEEALLHAK